MSLISCNNIFILVTIFCVRDKVLPVGQSSTGRYRRLERTDGMIGVESEGVGVGKRIAVSALGQHGG